MEKKISFRMWLSVFFGGIWQFIRKIFSWKYKRPVGRFLGVCLGILALFICFAIGYSVYADVQHNEYWAKRENVSSRIQYVRPYCSSIPGWISKVGSREKLIKNVEWVVAPANEDSLAIFSQGGKRGYFNRYTGHVSIPARYEAAWIFSNGIAAVADGDSIRFINERGELAIANAFRRDYRLNHVFHGEYCLMRDSNGGLGLINKSGNWSIAPDYDEIIPAAHNYWKMRKGDEASGLWYAFDDNAEPVNMDGVKTLEINEDMGVIYTLPNHLMMVIDFDGIRQEKFICQDIEAMYYDTDNRDEEGNLIQKRATLYRYRMADGYEGLCKADGELVTEPLYWTIRPVGKDIYHCTYKGIDCGVIINSNGEITQTKLQK